MIITTALCSVLLQGAGAHATTAPAAPTAPAGTVAAPAAQPDVSVTVYSSADPGAFNPQQFIDQQRAGWDPQSAWGVPGFGVVREKRRIAIPKGTGWVPFSDVAQFMDPTTVLFTDLDDPSTRVLEQRLEFDLVNGSKLMQKYIDREVVIVAPLGDSTTRTTGTLLSANGGQAVLKTESGIVIVPTVNASIELSSLPDGLRTKPTLLWHLASPAGGEHAVRIDYMTGGLTWRADYNLLMAADEKSASLAAWVTLLNVSGATWKDAELRLIAGSVRRVQGGRQQAVRAMRGREMAMAMDAGGFEEESFGEYHRYTLGFRVDLPANSTQQLTLFPTATGVKVAKELVYDGSYGGGFGDAPNLNQHEGEANITAVKVWILADNTEAAGLGMPLPAGKVRVLQMDDKGSSEFVGEDLIGHTARGGNLRLNIGDSFDVTGARRRMDFALESGRKTARETVEVTIKNGKKVAQQVKIRERLWRWSTWTLANAAVDGKPVEPTKTDASTIEQMVTVPAEGKVTFSYTAVYTW